MKKQCLNCKHEFQGRMDKKFCTTLCKSAYNNKLKRDSASITKVIDEILHKNHRILMELCLVENQTKYNQWTFLRKDLAKKGFQFDYFTGSYLNKQGKVYQYVYNFAWMEFSTQEVMIVKK